MAWITAMLNLSTATSADVSLYIEDQSWTRQYKALHNPQQETSRKEY
jgi:hypothetical protein